MHLAGAEGIEHGGKLSCRARYTEPVVGRALGEAEFHRAEREHRRARHFEVEFPLFDFGEMDEEICFDDAASPEDVASRGKEVFVAEGSERRIWVHERKRTPRLSRLLRAHRLRFGRNYLLPLEDTTARRSTFVRGCYTSIFAIDSSEARSICEMLVKSN